MTTFSGAWMCLATTQWCPPECVPRRNRTSPRTAGAPCRTPLETLARAGLTWVLATCGVALALVHPGTAFAQDAIDPAALQHDVAVRFASGDYAGVVEATAGVEKALRVKVKDPDFVPRMRLTAELLTRRAVAERMLGRLDAAEASLEAAGKKIGDRDVQRMVAMFVRSAGEKAAPAVVPLELTNLELVDAQLDLVLALIEAEHDTTIAATDDADAARKTGAEADQAPVQPAMRKSKARGDLRQTFNTLLYQSRGLRQGLDERLEKAEPAVRSSPASRALASPARPMLHAARAALIVAGARQDGAAIVPAAAQIGGGERMAATSGQTGSAPTAQGVAPPPADPTAAPPDPVALLTEALEAAEEAMAPALAAPEDEDRPAAEAAAALARAKYEAALVRAPYLEWRARARIMAGDTAAARADVQAALAERAAAGQRAHPDLVASLVVGGEAALAEATQTRASGDLAGARAAFEHAVVWLSRARDIAAACPGGFDAESPLPKRIDVLLASAVEARQNTVTTVATTDAVDAAARRALRALGARPGSPPRPAAAATP